ncbi:MAG: site-specific integrase [Anaerolineales bacterium]|nr:site-specific integrase [Anaerolineales bacterium]
MKLNQYNDGTISQAIDGYLKSVSLSRSARTARTYRNALNCLSNVLQDHHLPPEKSICKDLSEDVVVWLATALKEYAPTTERLYLTVLNGFFEFIAAERLADPNLPRVRMLIRQRSRRPGQRLPQFPRRTIENIISYAINIAHIPSENTKDYLRNLRDRAFIITLADTGLRVHEACALRRGDIDWDEYRAIIIGKGDQQAVVRFSRRCMKAIKDYLAARSELDGNSGKVLSSLPLFARHDRGAGKKLKPITPTTGRNIVAQRVLEAVGVDAVGTITPHSFRHYFVTTVLRGSGGNLKLAQALARHRNIAVTQRYAHLSDDELDQGYWEIFEES